MAKLIFFDEGHRYMLDGEQIPSVSEIIRFISREIYANVTQYNLDHAADRGTRVHKACELLDKYGTVQIDDDIEGYVEAYVKFRKEHNVTWDSIECACFSPEKDYAGTLDRIGMLDGELVILDIKTSCVVQKMLAEAQLNLYRRMVVGKDIKRLVILHLKADGTYKLIDIPISDVLAQACLTLHNATKKKNRKDKKR